MAVVCKRCVAAKNTGWRDAHRHLARPFLEIMDGLLCSILTSALSGGDDRFIGVASSKYVSLSTSTSKTWESVLCNKTFSFTPGFILYWVFFKGSATSIEASSIPYRNLFIQTTTSVTDIPFVVLPPAIAVAGPSITLSYSSIPSSNSIGASASLIMECDGANIAIKATSTMTTTVDTSVSGYLLCTLFAIAFPA